MWHGHEITYLLTEQAYFTLASTITPVGAVEVSRHILCNFRWLWSVICHGLSEQPRGLQIWSATIQTRKIPSERFACPLISRVSLSHSLLAIKKDSAFIAHDRSEQPHYTVLPMWVWFKIVTSGAKCVSRAYTMKMETVFTGQHMETIFQQDYQVMYDFCT
jgi:hypothetical protein